MLAALALTSAIVSATYVHTPDQRPARSGIPLGGLGCGTIEVRPDGTLSEWQIFNNTCHPVWRPHAFLAVRLDSPQRQAWALTTIQRGGANLTLPAAITFRGEFPFAWLSYDLGGAPLRVRVEAFSPFIPHQPELSSIPAIAFTVSLSNTSQQAITTTAAFFAPAAMVQAGAGPLIEISRASTGAVSGAVMKTMEGPPPSMSKRVRVLIITDNPDRRRLEAYFRPVDNLRVSFAAPRRGKLRLPARSAAELSKKFDVIWLAELGRASEVLGQTQMQMIRDAVMAGTGFIYTGGWDSLYGHDPSRWAHLNGTPIEEILPFRIKTTYDAVDRAVGARLKQRLPELETAALDRFPGVGGYNAIAGLKPGAQVILETTDGNPLLVLWTAGRGRVAAYLSTPFGGWPRLQWPYWQDFYATLVAYAAAATFAPSRGTPPSSPQSGEMFIGTAGTQPSVGRWSDLGAAWQAFASGSLPSGDGTNLLLAATVEIPPGKTQRVRFILAWRFPNHKDRRGRRDGNNYALRFKSALAAANKLAAEFAELRAASKRFHDDLYYSTLPYWLADAINAQLTTFFKSSWWDEQGNFGIWEGMHCCCGLNTVDVAYYGAWPITQFFPELQKRALRLWAQYQREDGRIPHLLAGTFAGIDSYGRIDLSPQFILQLARDYIYTGDRKLLRDLWPAAKAAYAATLALDSNGDGLPEHTRPGDQTYDGWAIMGESAYMGSLWLATLRAMQRLALEMGERREAAKYAALFEKARASYEKLLWTGSYYRLYKDPIKGGQDDGLMLDALNGQWYAHLLGLGDILPPERVRSHLRMCIKHNRIPVQRGMAYMVGDTGMCYVNCSWPGGKQRIGGQAGSPWTGTEYAFASLCIYEGMVEEGLQVVRDVYQRYYDHGMTWNHIECGQHYFRPMDVWTVLMALEGLRYDAPRGRLSLRPAIGPPLRAPVVIPHGWGVLRWREGQALRISWRSTARPLPERLEAAR